MLLPIERLETRRLLSSSPAGWLPAVSFISQAAAAAQPAAAASSSAHDHVELNPFYWEEINAPEEEAAPVPYANTTGPAAPPLTGSAVESVGFDSNAATSGYYNIPPDNNVAAGPNHVIDVVNTTLEIWTKSGTLLKRQRLGSNGDTAGGSFFASLNPLTSCFDAKVLYDQYSGRFVVVAAESTDTADGDAANTSRLLVAVSATSDPTGTWYLGAVNSKVTISGKAKWADYPGLGLDSQAIYVTANMFGFGNSGSFSGTRLWIIPKSSFYSGGAFTSSVYNPAGSTGLSTTAFTLQPAHLYGTAPTGVGTFLVSSGYVSGSTDQLSVIRVTSPLSSPTFTNQMINLGDVDNASAGFPGDLPQPGTTHTIDAGDERVMNAVWRNGSLWAVNTVNPPTGPDAGQATAHWYKINTANLSSLTLSDQGNISGDDLGTGTSTFYPWVMVDAAGDMAVSFAAAGPNLLPGAYYTGRTPTDAAGTVRTSATLAAGVDYYYRTFGGGANRWGDYSGLALDPADESTFWVFNQYAESRGTVLSGSPDEDGRWGTRFASFTFAVSLAGTVYSDDNFSASRDGAESGLPGQTVYLDTNGNGTLDPGEPSTSTDATGHYAFGGLLASSYAVRLLTPTNFQPTTPALLTTSAPSTTADFGLFPTLLTGTTPSTNQFSVRLNPAGTRLEISRAAAPLATPTYSAPVSSAPPLTFSTSGSGDALHLDLTNGNPVPPAGLTFYGSAAASLTLQAGPAADALTLSPTSLTLDGHTLSYIGPNSVSLSPGTGPLSLTLTGAARALLTPGNAKPFIFGALSLAPAATLDLTDNDVILTPPPAPTDTARQYLLAGQLFSSTAANATHNTAIGYATASALGRTTFDATAVPPTALLLKYTYTGDANLDGRVNADDLALLDRGLAKHLTGWTNGDFNYDNTINATDRTLLTSAYASQAAPL